MPKRKPLTPGQKAAATRRQREAAMTAAERQALDAKRRMAGTKAWATRRSNEERERRSAIARKAVATRRARAEARA